MYFSIVYQRIVESENRLMETLNEKFSNLEQNMQCEFQDMENKLDETEDVAELFQKNFKEGLEEEQKCSYDADEEIKAQIIEEVENVKEEIETEVEDRKKSEEVIFLFYFFRKFII